MWEGEVRKLSEIKCRGQECPRYDSNLNVGVGALRPTSVQNELFIFNKRLTRLPVDIDAVFEIEMGRLDKYRLEVTIADIAKEVGFPLLADEIISPFQYHQLPIDPHFTLPFQRQKRLFLLCMLVAGMRFACRDHYDTHIDIAAAAGKIFWPMTAKTVLMIVFVGQMH